MAEVIKREVIKCPDCGGVTRFAVYDCGCVTFERGGMHRAVRCPGLKKDFFLNQQVRCGQQGNPETHEAKRP